MSLTSAMLVGFTGINSNSVAVDTVGDNLANLNTTAFKGQRTLFESLLYNTVREGEPPSDVSGGTLPYQIGLGSTVGSVQRNFTQGGVESTGFPSDLAVEGSGFFVLERAEGDQVFSRDGSFRLDAAQTMVSADGARVQIFPANADGTIQVGALSDLVIPLGSTGPAVSTTEVLMEGQLHSGTGIASTGAVVSSQALTTSGGSAATDATALTALTDANGLPMFSDGDVLNVGGSKGGVTTEQATFVVGSTGTTLGDLAGFIEGVLGVNPDVLPDTAPGVSVSDGTEFPAGALVIRANPGEVNAVEMSAGSVTNTTGPVVSPFSFATVVPAVGGGVTTTFAVFDSLGNSADVRLRMALESKSETGTTWRMYAESVDDTDLSPILGTGTVTFDATGRFVGATGTQLSIDRAGVGSETPLSFTLNLSGLTGLASPDGSSALIMRSQDGAPAGVLTGFGIDSEGVVTGTYSNQQTEVFGQIALATFPNNEGLIALSDNTFTLGPDSGVANVVAPRTGSAGAVRSGMLEQSNVEIAREFINLITASTGISSASRVVRVADELLQELLLLAR